MHDYSDYTKPKSEDALAQLAELAEEQLKRQVKLAEAEKAVQDAKEELRLVSEVAIPELMESLGVESFTTASGLKVKIKENIRASVLKKAEHSAYRWLREQGHGALIKREVKVQFGMGEDEAAERTVALLGDLPVEDRSSVHAQTLSKFVRELLEAGQEVPEEYFSVYRQRVSNIMV